MVSGVLQATVDALSFEERAELADYITETLDPADFRLTSEQEEILSRRIASMEADPSMGLPWSEIKARFEAKWA